MTLTPRHLLSAFALLLLLSLGLASSSGGADAAAQLYQVKFTSGSQYLVIEFLDNNLVHFELSAVGTGPAAGHKIFTSPMVAKTDYTGPTSLLNDGHGNLETPDIRLQVDTVSLCITAWDKTHDPDLLLSNICPRNLDQPWKGINIAPSGFTNVTAWASNSSTSAPLRATGSAGHARPATRWATPWSTGTAAWSTTPSFRSCMSPGRDGQLRPLYGQPLPPDLEFHRLALDR